MIELLTWVSIIAGGILVILLLLSFLGGLDLDVDVGGSDTDAGSGIGPIKALLTLSSIGSWTMKIMLMNEKTLTFALIIGIISGGIAVLLLHYMIKLLLRNESNVNWSLSDALFKTGTVYLTIPSEGGNGIINVPINGTQRELKAKPIDPIEIKTGAQIVVMQIDGEFAIVKPE